MIELAVEFIGWMIGVAIMVAVCFAIIIVTFFRALWILFGPAPVEQGGADLRRSGSGFPECCQVDGGINRADEHADRATIT